MKNRKILFFPVEQGIAHITRSLAVAEKLKDKGWQPAFAASKSVYKLIGKARFPHYELKPLMIPGDISSIERLKQPEAFTQLITEEIKIIKLVNPDLIIVDFRLSAALSSAISKTPTIYFTGSNGLPYGCYIPNPGIPIVFPKVLKPIIKQLIWRAKRPYILSLLQAAKKLGFNFSENEIFSRMTYLIPEVPGYLPAEAKNLKLNYSGPIYWDNFTQYKPSWLNEINPDGKTVYLSFGGTGFDGKKLIALSSELVRAGFRVVVSSSNIAPVTDFPKMENLYVSDYISGLDICGRVDSVICHGGYGTMMQAIMKGKPVIAIPFNPDQLLHSLRIQELGLGKALINWRPRAIINLNLKSIQEAASSIPNAKIVSVLKSMLKTIIKYQKPISEFSAKLEKFSGAQKAADIIRNVTGS